jgi:hypothetical protein
MGFFMRSRILFFSGREKPSSQTQHCAIIVNVLIQLTVGRIIFLMLGSVVGLA